MRSTVNAKKKTVTIRLSIDLMKQVDSIAKQKGWDRSSTIAWIYQQVIQDKEEGTK